MKQKTAIYCRLSEEDRGKTDREDSESIQNQRKLLTSYAEERDWEIYQVYSDDNWSGLDQERPQWNALIRDAKAGRFGIVLCKSQARFTRDMEAAERYLHKMFPIWNIRFIGLADYADTDDPGNKKQRQINGLVNEWYCEDLSRNIRVVFDKKRKDGLFIGSQASYGYRKDPTQKGKLILDEPAAAIVRQIFQLYLEGAGTAGIAKILNRDGIPSPARYRILSCREEKVCGEAECPEAIACLKHGGTGLWSKTTVRRILKSEIYIGNMVQGVHKKISYKSKKMKAVPKEDWIIVEHTHEPIIDPSLFYKVREQFDASKRQHGVPFRQS